MCNVLVYYVDENMFKVYIMQYGWINLLFVRPKGRYGLDFEVIDVDFPNEFSSKEQISFVVSIKTSATPLAMNRI